MEYDYRGSRLTSIVGRFERPIVAAEEGLFVAVPLNGIVWFPPDGNPVHFSSKYLEQPSPNRRPVPFEEAHQLISIDGKLYLTSGKDFSHPLIYELDYQRGKATILLDARSLSEESPFWARFGSSITGGPPGKLLLWALPDVARHKGEVHRPRDGHLFIINLQDKALRQAKRPFQISHPWVFGGAQHHLVLQTLKSGIAIFNPNTLSIDWLMAAKDDTPRSISTYQLKQQEFVYNGRYLFTSERKSGAVSAREWRLYTGGSPKNRTTVAANWLLYEKDVPNPRRLMADNLPLPEKAWRYLINEQGQILMMTNKELFRVTLPTTNRWN